ncbi:MAG: hypothetical protein LBS54_06350 [Dysgonamonadaceae bacterium]|jgi:hypothetical protein|nr:hypothetical protein [Dysgonamonadaceae bacterium]
MENGYHPVVKRIGVPDRFIEHGTVPELYRLCGMDVESMSCPEISLHKTLGYDGNARYKIVQDSMDQAKMILDWADKHYRN